LLFESLLKNLAVLPVGAVFLAQFVLDLLELLLNGFGFFNLFF
jgi:hypothetical protein